MIDPHSFYLGIITGVVGLLAASVIAVAFFCRMITTLELEGNFDE